jgi:hypothetical protein
MKERPALEECAASLRYAQQGFTPLRRRKQATVVCLIGKNRIRG